MTTQQTGQQKQLRLHDFKTWHIEEPHQVFMFTRHLHRLILGGYIFRFVILYVFKQNGRSQTCQPHLLLMRHIMETHTTLKTYSLSFWRSNSDIVIIFRMSSFFFYKIRVHSSISVHKMLHFFLKADFFLYSSISSFNFYLFLLMWRCDYEHLLSCPNKTN
jgi:hypothetical protein